MNYIQLHLLNRGTQNEVYLGLHLPKEVVTSLVDAKEMDALTVIDEDTKHPISVLDQILSRNTPNDIRQKLMDMIGTTPSSGNMKGVDDQTKLALLKPRFIQTLAERAKFVEAINGYIESLSEEDKKRLDAANVSTETTETTETTEINNNNSNSE